MLKNIYICLGSDASIAIIKQFCRKNVDYFDKAGFCSPGYELLFKKFPAQISGLKYYFDFLFYPFWQDIFDLPSSEEALTLTKDTLLNKPHIHSLVYFFNQNSAVSINYNNISLIKNTFPMAILNICWIKAPFYSQAEINSLLNSFYASFCYISTFTNMYLSQQPNEITIKDYISNDKNLNIDFIQCEEKDILYQWQTYIDLPKPYPQTEAINFNFSPKVLAFIMAIQPLLPYKTVEGKVILVGEPIHYDWLSQENLLEFENDTQVKKQYLREYWKNKLIAIDNKNTTSSLPNKDCYEIVSEVPLTISTEDASVLISLLTPDFRKLIIDNIDQANLKYKSKDIRTAQGAFLLSENIIDEDKYKQLIAYPKGAHLPIAKDSIIQVCDAPPTVAVLTLCYNQENYIEENILSVMAQKTKFPVVHIIADDASTDGTQEILKKYAKKYPHIHLILNASNYAPLNIINLFNQAKTPYVSLCDGDDYFTDPLKLQKQVDLLEANPSYGLCFHLVKILYEDYPGIEHIYPTERVLHRGVRPHYYLADLMRRNLMQTNSVMYRWRFRDGLPAWFNAHLCPGDWYWHLLHAECGNIGFINEVMSVYRRHKGGLFYQTINNVEAHRRQYGAKEIAFYDHLNLHFEGRYARIMENQIKRVFNCMYVEAEKTGDSSAFEDLIKEYPHHYKKLQAILS